MNDFVNNEQDSIAPKIFIALCNPSWARVYMEVSYGRDPSLDRLAWDSNLVRKEFISLTGFNPAILQYANFIDQHEALNVARELDYALYSADEEEQLDGPSALQFAAGWLAAYTWLNLSDESEKPNSDQIKREADKASSSRKHKENFLNGFMHRAGISETFIA